MSPARAWAEYLPILVLSWLLRLLPRRAALGAGRALGRIAFILGLPVGGVLAAALAGGFAPTLAFGALDELTGGSLVLKAGILFVGGLLIGAGARWAGGCPSGHSIVGIAQGAVSSLVATVAFVVSGVVVYNLLVALLGD